MSVTITDLGLDVQGPATSTGIIQHTYAGAPAVLAFVYDKTDGVPDIGMIWLYDKAGGVSLLRGKGTNRFSLESDGSITLMSDTSLIEMEGANNADPLSVVGFIKGSAVSKTINFTNIGTTDPKPPVRVTATDNSSNIQEWYQGTTLKAYIDKDGNFVRVST